MQIQDFKVQVMMTRMMTNTKRRRRMLDVFSVDISSTEAVILVTTLRILNIPTQMSSRSCSADLQLMMSLKMMSALMLASYAPYAR